MGLLEAVQGSIQTGELKACIRFLFTNREPGEAEGSDRFIQAVRGYGIPVVALSSARFSGDKKAGPSNRRSDYDKQVLRLLKDFSVDLCVMAGYMRVVIPEFCEHFNIVNIHPALPGGPKGRWQNVIWELIEGRARETGVMVHRVTEAVDEGPPLSYCSFPTVGGSYDRLWAELEGKTVEEVKSTEGEENPLFRMIRQEGVRREQHLLVETLIAIARGAIEIGDVDQAKGPRAAVSLNREVEGRLHG